MEIKVRGDRRKERSVGQKQQEIKQSKRRVNPRSGLMGQAWTDVKMKGRRQ